MDIVNGHNVQHHHPGDTIPTGLVKSKSGSMLNKSVLKRQVNREHNSNFRAGHVDVQESCLQKAGLRGRKSYFLYAVLTFMLVMVLINLGVTLMIMVTLQIHYEGMHSLQFLPSQVLHFATPVVMPVITQGNTPLVNYVNKDLTVMSTGDSGLVSLHSQPLYSETPSTTVNISESSVITISTSEFVFITTTTSTTSDTSNSWETLLNTSNTLLNPDLYTGYNNLTINRLQLPKLTSGIDEDLYISSNSCVIRGNEGLSVSADSVKLSSSNSDILIDVYQGSSLIISSVGGIYLTSLPYAEEAPYNSYTVSTVYRMCVCKSTGKLFTVPVFDSGYSCLNSSNICQ